MPARMSGLVGRQLGDRDLGAQQSRAAAGDDAFLDRRAGGVQRVVDAGPSSP